MKILIYGMSEIHGGVESFIKNYSSHFSNEVHVDYITDFQSIPFEEEFLKKKSKIFKLPSRRTDLKGYNKAIKKVYESNHYDVVWANVCSLSSIGVLTQAKKYGVRKRIVHSHNSMNMSGIVTNLLHKYNKARIKSVATDFWACSVHAGEWMFPKNVGEIKVINNAIEASNFTYDPKRAESKRIDLGLDDNFVIGNVGRFHYQKNHEFLVSIFSEILKVKSNAILILVGSGDLEEDVKRQVKSLGIDEAVRFLGQRNDVPDLLQAFDVFLLPSRFEGLPFVLVEAQASGLVSYTSDKVVSEQSKISDLLHFIGLEKNAKEWADYILDTVTPKKYSTQEIIEAGFDIKTEAAKVERLFRG